MKKIFRLFTVIALIYLSIMDLTSCTKKCSTYCSFRTNIKAGNYGDGFCRFGECGSPQICQSNQTWPKIKVSALINNQWVAIVNNPGLPLGTEGHSPWISGRCISISDFKKLQDVKITFDPSTFLVKGASSSHPNQCILYKIDGNFLWRLTPDNSKCGLNIDIQANPLKDYNDQIIYLPCNCSN